MRGFFCPHSLDMFYNNTVMKDRFVIGISIMQHSGKMKKIAELWKLIIPYWKSEEKYKAWSMLALILGLNLGFVYISVKLNEWNVKFYNAIQQLDQDTFLKQCYIFFGWLIVIISIFVTKTYFTNLLGFHWRRWLTKYYLNRWVSDAMFYRLSLEENRTDNPDQRIAQDLANFPIGILSWTVSLFKETVNLVSFVVILWSISGPIEMPLPNGTSLTIHGYMVWIAIIYAILGTMGVFKIGRPLINLDFNQERFEANFRYQLVRLREKSEEVALYHGEKFENHNFRDAFHSVYKNFRQIINRSIFVTAWQKFYEHLSTIFPFLIAAPRFFSGAITFGILMQIFSAFTRVQDSLAIIVDNFKDLAGLIATSNRILGFTKAMQNVENKLAEKDKADIKLVWDSESEPGLSGDALNTLNTLDTLDTFDTLVLENLSLKTPKGHKLIENLNVSIKNGEKVLIMGRSGLGKSTILRAIAGYWNFGSGKIKLPKGQRIFIVPQRPYMPLGTLRQALYYPGIREDLSDEKLLEILTACRLEHLMPMLDEQHDWSLQLSMGEQQRIIFARVIIHKPSWIMMDEPSASMDKETEKQVYTALEHYLPESTIITIGHSPSLKAFHSRVLELDSCANPENLIEAHEMA